MYVCVYVCVCVCVCICMCVCMYARLCICLWSHVYMAAYSYIYPYILYISTQKVHTTASNYVNTQESGVYYIQLIQL